MIFSAKKQKKTRMGIEPAPLAKQNNRHLTHSATRPLLNGHVKWLLTYASNFRKKEKKFVIAYRNRSFCIEIGTKYDKNDIFM